MLRAALNKSWIDHVTNKEFYGKIPRITVTYANNDWGSPVTDGESEAK